ncbi:uncharacterized protein LOC120432760 [Oreochromis aureus]|uniref:uncharacterized protein LOC120432760 n=1 Tax=Oreochromis aureus TaxID=47969 RepID=UPI0019546822|nr:uncharacterized protein LOC120432760 [Oreochromis aureus]
MAAQLIQDDLTLTRRVGESVSFSCGDDECDYTGLIWYQKKDTEPFRLVLFVDTDDGRVESSSNHSQKDDFSVEIKQNRYRLKIEKVKLEHSATYYCACWKDAPHSEKSLTTSSSSLTGLNVDKTKEMIVDFRKTRSTHAQLSIHGSTVETVNINIKFLGVHISDDLTWTINTASITKKDIFHKRYISMTFSIVLDPSHPSHGLFSLLPSVCLTVEGGYDYDIFGSGTKLYVTDEQVVKPVVSVYPAASRAHLEGNSSLLCVASAMFPPLVQFSWKRQKKNGGEAEELPPAEGEQLELRESGYSASILVVNRDDPFTYMYSCRVRHQGGTVEAQTRHELLSYVVQSQCRVKLLCLLYTVLIVKSLVYCCGLSLLMILTNKGPSTNCTHADCFLIGIFHTQISPSEQAEM